MSKSVGNVVDPIELIRRLRRRPAALFPAARGHLRPGRQLQRRGDRQPRQCRSRQQLRQSRPAHLVFHRQGIATACCRAEGRAMPADEALARPGRARPSASELPAHFEALALSPGDRGLAAGGLRLQPVYRQPGALGAAQDRSRADDRGARHALRRDPRPRHRDPAGHPGLVGEAARRDGRAGRASGTMPRSTTTAAMRGSPRSGFTPRRRRRRSSRGSKLPARTRRQRDVRSIAIAISTTRAWSRTSRACSPAPARPA